MPTTAGSIIIHKGNAAGTGTGTASGTAPTGFQGLGGVIFTAYPISNIDLTTNAGWATLSAITATSVGDQACTDAKAGTGTTVGSTSLTFSTGIVSKATALDGSTTISPAGPTTAYLVCETNNSAATDSSGNPVNVVAPAQPFIVSVPFPDNSGTNTWLTNVNVYPKNGTATITKTVTDQPADQVVLGSVAQFPVTTTVPYLPPNSTFKYYIVHDPMDPAGFSNVGVASVTLNGTALAVGTDYTVTITGTTVDVSFTSTGLGKLAGAPGGSVVTTFQGTVKAVGAFSNTATLYTDTQTGTTPPTNPPVTPPVTPPTNPPVTPPVTINWGQLVINKVDSSNGSTLSGAEFQVFNAVSPYGDCSKAVATGSALPVGTGTPGTTVTTDNNGQITISGLFVSDSYNHAGVTSRCYVVTETKAPTGYMLPSPASQGVAVSPGAVSGNLVKFSDTKQAVPGLPLTGAQGTMVASILGLILIGGGVSAGAVAVRNRRRQRVIA